MFNDLIGKFKTVVLDFYHAISDVRRSYKVQKEKGVMTCWVLDGHEAYEVSGKSSEGWIFPRGFRFGAKIVHVFTKRPSGEPLVLLNPDIPMTYDPSMNMFEEEIEKASPVITQDDEGRTITTYEPYKDVVKGARILNNTAYELFEALIFRNLRRVGDYNILFVVASVGAIFFCLGMFFTFLLLVLFGG